MLSFPVDPCPRSFGTPTSAALFSLNGMFSFVLLDTRDQSFIAARDAFGITPLYIGWGLDGLFSSVVAIFFEFLAGNI